MDAPFHISNLCFNPYTRILKTTTTFIYIRIIIYPKQQMRHVRTPYCRCFTAGMQHFSIQYNAFLFYIQNLNLEVHFKFCCAIKFFIVSKYAHMPRVKFIVHFVRKPLTYQIGKSKCFCIIHSLL